MGVLLRIIVKEFLQLRRDRKMLPALIIGPAVQLLALGYAANRDVLQVSMVLVDQDRTAASRGLADQFVSSGYFRIAGSEDVATGVDPWLVEGRAQMALVIPAGFGRDLEKGRRPSVQVIADGTDASSTVVGLGYAAGILAEAGVRLAEGRPGGARIALSPRVWYNPDLRSRWFYVPAILAMTLMLTTMILPSMAVVREKEIGTLEQLIVTPIRPWQLIAGKLTPFVVVGIADTVLVTGLAVFQFGVPLRGSFLLLLGLTFLFLLTTLGLGLLVSTIVRTQQQAMMASVYLLMIPMIYLSGLIFPIDNMPQVIQRATFAIPLRYYTNIIRGVFLKGSGIEVLWPEAMFLGTFGVATLGLASLRFRKRLD